ncbi:MAG TPA: glycosyltransferase family 4 protein, partial [Tepidisphaeraceae bacterium]|nr:glycosyltransferase family 4 protein [Tepidisphaeraceae bacterium]
HSCVLSWWRAVKGEEAPPEWNRYRQAVATGLRSVQMVVAPSRAMLNAIGQHYGPLDNTRVIYNGRDSANYLPAPKEPLILCAGRLWDEAKNLMTLDHAATGLSWPVLAAGDDHAPEGSATSAHHVQKLGQLDETQLAHWMSRAATYALPARYEPFGLSVLEAAFSGCALVLGDIPSLREIWSDAAVFVPPNDVAALARALTRLIDNPHQRQALAYAARNRARRYTPQAMADAYLDVYRHLITTAQSKELSPPCASCSSTTRSCPTGITETPISSGAS